jgi:Family of unknown function (DUF6152)
MNLRSLKTVVLTASLMAVSATAIAHHSVSGQFDPEKIEVADAVLKKVEWINPHSYFTYAVKQPDGSTVDTAIETGAPAALRRAGLSSKEALKVGDTYTIYYHPSRSGNPVGLMIAFNLPDGRLIGAHTADEIEKVKKLAAERAARKPAP